MCPPSCLAWSQTVTPGLHWRLLDTHRQVWLSLLWGYCSFLLAPVHPSFVCAFQESISPVLWKFYNQIPLASKVKFPRGSQSLCWIPTLGNLLWVLGLVTVWEFLWYDCFVICGSSAGQLYGRANGDLLQEGLWHMLNDPGLLKPETLCPCQTTADPYLCKRHSLKGRSGSVSVGSLCPGAHMVLIEASEHLWWFGVWF